MGKAAPPKRNMALTGSLFAPHPPAPVAAPAAMSDWRTETAGLIRAARERMEVDSAMRAAAAVSGGGAPAQPAPTSVSDLLALSRESREATRDMAEAASGQAKVARDEAESERRRRAEVEASAQSARDQGRKEADSQGAMILGILEKANDNQTKMLERLYEQQRESDRAKTASDMETLSARLDGLEKTHTLQLAHKDEEIARLRSQVQAAGQRETIHEALSRSVFDPDLRQQLRQTVAPVLGLTGQSEIQDPNLAFQSRLAPALAEVVADSARQKLSQQGEQHGAQMYLLHAAGDMLGVVRAAAAKFAGIPLSVLNPGAAPQGAPQEPVESAWPEGGAE